MPYETDEEILSFGINKYIECSHIKGARGWLYLDTNAKTQTSEHTGEDIIQLFTYCPLCGEKLNHNEL